MTYIAPGVYLPGKARRVLHEDDNKEADYLAALEEVHKIRSELSALRWRLRDLGDVEAFFDFDSTAKEAAGALSMVIMGLYHLEDPSNSRSFVKRAERTKALWQDVQDNPDNYIIEPGSSKNAFKKRN